MISPEAFREALMEMLEDRDLFIETGSFSATEVDAAIKDVEKEEHEKLLNMSEKEKNALYREHIEEYEEKHQFFVKDRKETTIGELLINDVKVFTDLYEVEVANSPKDEVDRYMLGIKAIYDKTSEHLGGSKGMFEIFDSLRNANENDET